MAFARTTALEFLRRAHEQNRLAHAYLITGAPGSGKELLAAELASLVNGTPAKDVFSAKAREVFIARPESKSRRIVTAQIRALLRLLGMPAGRLGGRDWLSWLEAQRDWEGQPVPPKLMAEIKRINPSGAVLIRDAAGSFSTAMRNACRPLASIAGTLRMRKMTIFGFPPEPRSA